MLAEELNPWGLSGVAPGDQGRGPRDDFEGLANAKKLVVFFKIDLVIVALYVMKLVVLGTVPSDYQFWLKRFNVFGEHLNTTKPKQLLISI
jgi:hypothetical protein